MFYQIFLLCILLPNMGFSDQKNPEELVVSTPDQLAHQDRLVGQLIGPLGGQFVFKQTDLVVKGAEPLSLDRHYIAPSILPSYHGKGAGSDLYYLYLHADKAYRGWVFMPHQRLQILSFSNRLRVTDANGVTLDYRLMNGNTILATTPHGISNYAGGTPGGKHDLRNTCITREGDKKIIIRSPDGVVRTYNHSYSCFFLLEKERLPNGRIVRYRYLDNGMVVESVDPSEEHVYASIAMTGTPKQGTCEFKTSSAQKVSYEYETRVISVKWEENKRDKHSATITSPPLLKTVNGLFRIPETISYNDRFQLDSYHGGTVQCQCQYRAAKTGVPATVHALSLPVGDDNAVIDVHTLSYDAPIAGVQDGSTTVDNIDGTRVVYHYSKTFLPQKIAFYGVDKKLKKQTLYQWSADQRLISMEWVDDEERLLCRKSYEYDKLGNPILETLTGDLTGRGETESYTTRRLFSDDGLHVLLREETEAGKIVTCQYLPNTNLLTARLIQDGTTIISREFWVYDECHNLIQTIADDGVAAEKDDLMGITQRTITSYVLRKEQPFLHMPEWTEESYWEFGENRLLRRTHHTYDQYGNVCQDSVYGADGQFAYNLHRTYNARGQLLSETNALGQTASYSYDDKGRCILSCDVSRRVEQHMHYDARGRLRQRVEIGCDRSEHTTTYAYDFNDRLIQQSDPLGNLTHYTYDLLTNKVTSTESPAVASLEVSPVPVLKRTNYDTFGRKILEVDANGNATTFRCNAYGSPVEIIHSDGSHETFVYTKSGKIQQYVDVSGLTITYTYDALERLVKKSYASSIQESIAEEVFVYRGNSLVSKTDKEGHVTNYGYDGAGRKSSDTFAGRTTLYSYDNLGRLISITKQNGQNSLVIRVKLDLLGRILETVKLNLAGSVLQRISHTYDDAGNRVTTTRDRAGSEAIERTSYDAFKRCVVYMDALGYTTRTLYDETQCNALGQRILTKTTIDPNGVRTVVIYDSYGREVKKEVLQGAQGTIASQEMCYDPVGNLLEHRDHLYHQGTYQKTQGIAYTYDQCNRVSSITRGVNTSIARMICFEYGQNGQLATKTLPTGITLNYTYDPMGHLRSITSSDGNLALTYGYDRLGRLLHATDERHQMTIDRTLDAFGNVLSEHFPMGITLRKTYDALDRPLTLAWSDQARVDYSYDPVHLRSVSHSLASNQVLYSHRYEDYDLDGNLQEECLMGGLGRVQHVVDLKGRKTDMVSAYFNQHCAYDAVNNLVHSTVDKSNGDYGYDDLAQLTSETTSGSVHTYLHDSHHNRVLADDIVTDVNDLDELLSSGSISCTYDLNGNLNTKRTPTQTLHFTYDPLNRLTHAASETAKIEITYDPLGRRLSKVVHTMGYFGWGESCREHYLYDGENEIGAFSAQGKPKQVRTLGLAKHKNVPATVAIELDGKLYVPILDCQGNICRLINPTWGSITEHYQFDAFGKELQDPSGHRNPWRYASKRFDPELQLVYFGKRYYDPQLARWLTTDPAGFIDSTNLYAYLLNNPFRYVDPDGRFVMALPLLTWGVAGLGWALPSLTTIVTTTLLTTAVWYASETALTHLGQYIAHQEWKWEINKEKYPAGEFVGTPGELQQDPKWTETTHPEARKRGRREFVNNETGEVIEYDKGRPGEPGHRAHDHYHHQNPNSKNRWDKYFDNDGNTCPEGKESYHIYPPEGITWDY